MNYAGPQQNVDQQVSELRATARYHRGWARLLNFTGWVAFIGAVIVQITQGTGGPWLAMFVFVAVCWAWRHYEEGQEREVREELWDYCREGVQKYRKWERQQ